MRRFLPLLLCLSLSIFTAARATKQIHALSPDTKSNPKPPMGQHADARTLLKDPNTEQETGSSDDGNKDDASSDEGEDVNDDDGSNAGADEDAGDDNGADENEGDDGGDDGGE